MDGEVKIYIKTLTIVAFIQYIGRNDNINATNHE